MSISFTIYSLQLSSLFFPPSLVIYLFLYPTLFFFLKHFTLCRITSLTLYPFNFFSFSHLHLQRQLIFRGCATSHALRNAAGRRCAALGTSAQCRTPVAPVFFLFFFAAVPRVTHCMTPQGAAVRREIPLRGARRKTPTAQGACGAKCLQRKAPAAQSACGARRLQHMAPAAPVLFYFFFRGRAASHALRDAEA